MSKISSMIPLLLTVFQTHEPLMWWLTDRLRLGTQSLVLFGLRCRVTTSFKPERPTYKSLAINVSVRNFADLGAAKVAKSPTQRPTRRRV